MPRLDVAALRVTDLLVAPAGSPESAAGDLADALEEFLAAAAALPDDSGRAREIARHLAHWGTLDGEEQLAQAEQFGVSVGELAQLDGVTEQLALIAVPSSAARCCAHV